MAQMRLHRPGCFVRYALGDEADDVKLGGGERVPARGRSFAFAAAALGVAIASSVDNAAPSAQVVSKSLSPRALPRSASASYLASKTLRRMARVLNDRRYRRRDGQGSRGLPGRTGAPRSRRRRQASRAGPLPLIATRRRRA